MDGKAYDGGPDAVDHVDYGTRIGIKQCLIVGRDGWRRGGGSGASGTPESVGEGNDCHGISVL